MSQIAVPEKFSAELHDLAAQDRRAVEDVVDEAINSYLASRFHEPQLTSADIEHLREGIAHLDRGERIASEYVDRKFENWRKQRASR